MLRAEEESTRHEAPPQRLIACAYMHMNIIWFPTSVGSRPSATSLRGDGKVGPSGSSPGGARERGSR